MKIYVKASKKNRVMASDTTPISEQDAQFLIDEFIDYAKGVKDYLSYDKNWKVNYNYVAETNAKTGAIRNIFFDVEYYRMNPDNGKYEPMILVEFMYDLDGQYDMTVKAMCPILRMKRTFLCGTNDAQPFESTNIEGLQTIQISPMMEKIDEMVYDGVNLSKWFLS